ncbi:hypothetical protein [Streptomyces sp. MI02-7b]|uniref:hypothetical protein n=1 Tax=Streptomyces sp. MI02-7b TaxID=462941 RepID=UPI0029A2DE54|nr:hypothetical protein [Streptomyces sp. MI02-7b]MDX3072209.1 hypothetical protein [Streptomyces sp. MI02-7b]
MGSRARRAGRAATAALAAAVVWGTAGDAAIAEKPMSRAAVTADIAAVTQEAGAVSETHTVTGVLVAGTGGHGRPLREECLVTKDIGPVEARGTASRITASLRRHGWRRLDRAPRQSPGSVRYARRGWTLSVTHSAWPFANLGTREDWTFIALRDRC